MISVLSYKKEIFIPMQMPIQLKMLGLFKIWMRIIKWMARFKDINVY